MNTTFLILLLFALQIFYWCIGKYAAKKIKATDDYFLGGKSIKFFPLMMTFLATQVGGGTILGSSEEAYQSGLMVILYPLGNAIGLMALGLGLGGRLAESQVSTVAEIFEKVYRSPFLKKVASLLSIVSLFMILTGQIIASNKFLISMGIDSTFLFLLFWVSIILYTVQGGLQAVISTDLFQASFFTGVFIFALGFIFWTQTGVAMSLQDLSFEFLPSKITGWLLMPFLMIVVEQDMAQRCFAGDSKKTVNRAAFVAGGATLLICLIPIYLGLLAKKMEISIPTGGSVLMSAIEQLTNPFLSAFVGCAVLAAIISTATALINAISSNLSLDFCSSSREQASFIKRARMMTVCVSCSALFFSLFFNNIIDILIQSYELLVGCLFVPVIYALLRRGQKGGFNAALFAILCGFFSFVMVRIYPTNIPRELLNVGFSWVGFFMGTQIDVYREKRLCMQKE